MKISEDGLFLFTNTLTKNVNFFVIFEVIKRFVGYYGVGLNPARERMINYQFLFFKGFISSRF